MIFRRRLTLQQKADKLHDEQPESRLKTLDEQLTIIVKGWHQYRQDAGTVKEWKK